MQMNDEYDIGDEEREAKKEKERRKGQEEQKGCMTRNTAPHTPVASNTILDISFYTLLAPCLPA